MARHIVNNPVPLFFSFYISPAGRDCPRADGALLLLPPPAAEGGDKTLVKALVLHNVVCVFLLDRHKLLEALKQIFKHARCAPLEDHCLALVLSRYGIDRCPVLI